MSDINLVNYAKQINSIFGFSFLVLATTHMVTATTMLLK